jgi:hypothetical protein
MRGAWAEAADALIYRLHEDLGERATLDDRKAMLRAHASEFHCNTSWGKKVWSRRARTYLERYGLPPIERATPKPSPWPERRALQAAREKMAAPDIIFPFRSVPA